MIKLLICRYNVRDVTEEKKAFRMSGRMIEEVFQGVPDDERSRMLAESAIEFFHLE